MFSVAEPTDRWEEELNPKSEIVYQKAIVDPSVVDICDSKLVDKWKSNAALQFERNVSYIFHLYSCVPESIHLVAQIESIFLIVTWNIMIETYSFRVFCFLGLLCCGHGYYI